VVRVTVTSCSIEGEKCSDSSREMGWEFSSVTPSPASASTGTTTGFLFTITMVVRGSAGLAAPVASMVATE